MADAVPSIPSTPSTAPVSGNAPVSPVAPATPAPQQLLGDVPVQQAPASLTQPAVPVTVQGTVIASNPQAQQIRIQTAQGEIVLQSAASLPPQTPVSVEVYTDRSQTLASLVVFQQTTDVAQPLEQAVTPMPALQEGQTVTALQLPPAAAPVRQLPQESLPLEKAGDPLQHPLIQKLLSAYLPGRSAATPPEILPVPEILDNNLLNIMRAQLHAKAAQQTMQSPAMPPEKPAAAAPPVLEHLDALLSFVEKLPPQRAPFPDLPPQQPQNMYELKIIRIFPPRTPPEQIKAILQKISESPKPLTPPPQLAEVESATLQGAPVLKIGEDHFVLQTPVTVPPGSTVIVDAAPLTPKQITAGFAPAVTVKAFDPLSSSVWPALHEALQTVMQTAPPAVAQAFRNTLPTPTQNLAPTALFFLAALRLGSVEKWLGENTLKILHESGKKDLPGRLGDDFGKISSQSREPLGDNWRSISIPLLHDDQLSQMQFWIRRQHDQDGSGRDSEKKPATRFILNLHLSRMGEMQLDGFIQKKKFDIVLRTAEKLPFSMRQELMARFAQGLEQVHMQGGISFQGKQQGWVTVELPHQAGISA